MTSDSRATNVTREDVDCSSTTAPKETAPGDTDHGSAGPASLGVSEESAESSAGDESATAFWSAVEASREGGPASSRTSRASETSAGEEQAYDTQPARIESAATNRIR